MKETHDKQTIDLFGIGVDLNAIDPETYRMLSGETALAGASSCAACSAPSANRWWTKHRDDRCCPSSLCIPSSAARFGALLYCRTARPNHGIAVHQIWKESSPEITCSSYHKFRRLRVKFNSCWPCAGLKCRKIRVICLLAWMLWRMAMAEKWKRATINEQ